MSTRVIQPGALLRAARLVNTDGEGALRSATDLIGGDLAQRMVYVFVRNQQFLFRHGTGCPHDPRMDLDLLVLFYNTLIDEQHRGALRIALNVAEQQRYEDGPKMLEELVAVSPPMWPERSLRVQPGDLSRLAPKGNGVYGLQEHEWHPIRNAPTQEAAGGTLYFGARPESGDIQGLLRLLEVTTNEKQYAVFLGHSSEPGKEGYLRQIRLVPRFALCYLYGALDEREYREFPVQPLSVGELVEAFIAHQQQTWGTFFGSRVLARLFGGDGNYAQEELGFGFMVENDYHHVYRLWSRAWLVTK